MAGFHKLTAGLWQVKVWGIEEGPGDYPEPCCRRYRGSDLDDAFSKKTDYAPYTIRIHLKLPDFRGIVLRVLTSLIELGLHRGVAAG